MELIDEIIYPNRPVATNAIKITKFFSIVETGFLSPNPIVEIEIKIKYEESTYLS